MSEGIKQIPLTVENAGGVERKAWPITQGVPGSMISAEL